MLDFERFARDHKISYVTEGHHHCHQGWAQLHCPQCTDGRHGLHLGFNLIRGGFNCWRCGPVKTVVAIQGLVRVAPDKAWEILRKYDGGKSGKARSEPVRQRQVPLPPGLGPLRAQHLKYLKNRGFSEAIVEEWDLRATRHLSGSWNWRVVFPIYNVEALPIAYCGRSIVEEAKPKYKMTDNQDCAEDPKGFLYGIHRVPGDSVIVVEGPADVWNVGPGAVATLGIDWKPEQMNKLRKYPRRFVMYDPEKKAQQRASQLAEALSLYPGETEIISDLPSDPGSLNGRLIRRLRKILLGKGD